MTVVVGLVVVLLDLRFGSGGRAFDLLPDPVGWIVVAVALGRLAHLQRGFRLGAVAAGIGALVSAPLWPGPDLLGETAVWLGVLEGVVDLVVVVGTLSGVMAVLPRRAGSAHTLRTTYVVVAGVYALLAVGGLVSTGLVVLALMATLVNLVVTVIVLIFLGSVSSETPDPAQISR